MTIVMWEQSDAVWRVQALLGFVGLDVLGDGIYGPETSAAVKKFQQARGLDPSGLVDDATMVDLESAFNEGWKIGAPSVAAKVVSAPSVPVPASRAVVDVGAKPPWLLLGGVGVLVLFLFGGGGGKKGGGRRSRGRGPRRRR